MKQKSMFDPGVAARELCIFTAKNSFRAADRTAEMADEAEM